MLWQAKEPRVWKANQPTPPDPGITEMPKGACPLTPELCEFLGIPDLQACVRAYLKDYADGVAPELVFKIPESTKRAPGPHVTHLGHSEFGGLCKRQLWLRYTTENGDKPLDYTREMVYQQGHLVEAWLAAVLEQQLAPLGWRCERNLPCDYVHPRPASEEEEEGSIFTGELDMLFSGEGWSPTRERFEHIQFIVDSKATSDEKLASMSSPNASNVAQQQGYLESESHGATFAILAYVARQHEIEWFFVPPAPAETVARGNEVLDVHSSLEAPQALPPRVERGTPLKSDNSVPIKIKLPWQCGFCSYIDTPGCPTSLPQECRTSKLWGHQLENGKFRVKPAKGDDPGGRPLVEEFGELRLAELLIGG